MIETFVDHARTGTQPDRPPAGVQTDADRRPGRWPRSRRTGVGLVVGGLVTVALVAVGLVATAGRPAPAPIAGSTTAAPVPPAVPRGITLSGTEGVQVQMVTYLAHEGSGWHRHSGLHAVAVLSGTLTVYGADCQPRHYGVGEAYVGGQGVHLARNETDAPLEMAVTYLFPAGSAIEEFVIAAAPPVGCTVR